VPSFLSKFPNFKLVRPWHEALYGPADVPLVQVTSRQTQPIPALNGLEIGLSTGGDVEFGSSDWKVI
jgi:hypothetical protein